MTRILGFLTLFESLCILYIKQATPSFKVYQSNKLLFLHNKRVEIIRKSPIAKHNFNNNNNNNEHRCTFGIQNAPFNKCHNSNFDGDGIKET